MRSLRNRPRGTALVGMLMALIIVFILSGMYFGPGPGGGAASAVPWVLTLPDRTRSTVCDANRRTAETTLMMNQISFGSNLTTSQMAKTASQLPRCPGAGRFYVDENILCTAHVLTPKFRERLGLL